MADRSKQSRDQAETAFRKTQKEARAKDKSEAMQQYESERDATLKKTARLKELRLAREADDASAATKKKPRKRKPASGV
jgi:hypothetical protein